MDIDDKFGGLVSVALRKESVDRNILPAVPFRTLRTSLSARRAWIEIYKLRIHQKQEKSLSARRAWIEITPAVRSQFMRTTSLSARRAWIEIVHDSKLEKNIQRSLSARRAWIEIFPTIILYAFLGGRSPQGERG